MTEPELQVDLTTKLNNQSASRFSPTVRLNALNEANAIIYNAADWPFAEYRDTSLSTVIGQEAYTKPAIIRSIKGVWLGVRDPDHQLDPVSDSERDPILTTTPGQPTNYYIFGNTIELICPPASVQPIIIEGFRTAPLLVTSGPGPEYPAEYHGILTMIAAALLRMSSGGSEASEATAILSSAEVRLAAMKRAILPKQKDRTRRVKDVYDARWVPTGSFIR